MTDTTRTLIWADGEQLPLLQAVIEHAQLEPVAVGSDNATAAADLADDLNGERVTDLRQAIQRSDLDLIWLAGALPADIETLQIIRQVNRPAITCEPSPASVHDLLHHSQLAGVVRFVPFTRRAAGYRAAVQVLDDFGPIDCVSVSLRSGRGQGSLLARLYDAMDVIHSLCGPAQTISASLSSPTGHVPGELAAMSGHMTINMRFADNRCACIAASDRAGRWFQGVTALGDGGCLRIDQYNFEWIDPAGSIIDHHHESDRADTPGPGELIATELKRMLQHRETAEPPVDASALLALCEAALVSCRTGQGETPGKMLEMLRRP